MEQYNLDELIAAFLKGKLSKAEAATLKKLIESDPKIAELVDESTEAYHFLQYLKYKQIRNQLKEMDQNNIQGSKKFKFRRWITILLLVIIAIVAAWIFLAQSFDPQYLAQKNFEPVVIDDVHLTYSPEDILQLNTANEYFQQHDFQNASRIFSAYTLNETSGIYAKWNLLMCHLALSGPDEFWKSEMLKFLAIPSNPFSSRGI